MPRRIGRRGFVIRPSCQARGRRTQMTRPGRPAVVLFAQGRPTVGWRHYRERVTNSTSTVPDAGATGAPNGDAGRGGPAVRPVTERRSLAPEGAKEDPNG